MNNEKMKDRTMQKTMSMIGALVDNSSWENGSSFPIGNNRTGHVYKGGAGLTTSIDTRSVVITYAPELSARSNRSHAMVYERNSSSEVIRAQKLIVGPELSKQFSALGVASGTLKVVNSSARDNASGTIQGTCLNDIDKEAWALTRTDLESYAAGVVATSKASGDGICIAAISQEIGGHAVKVRPDSLVPLVARSVSTPARAGFKVAGTTEVLSMVHTSASAANGFVRTGVPFLHSTVGTGSMLAAGTEEETFFNMGSSTFANGDFSRWHIDSNVYNVAVVGHVNYSNTGVGLGNVSVHAELEDAAGNLILRVENVSVESKFQLLTRAGGAGSSEATQHEESGLHIDFEAETTAPIARVVLKADASWEAFAYDNGDYPVQLSVDSARLELKFTTRDADIPDTPMAVAVLEGLNGNDSLDVTASTFIYGTLTADQSNLLRNSNANEVYDSSLTKSLVDTYVRNIPDAWEMGQYSAMNDNMNAIASDPEISQAFSWGDFKKIASRVSDGIHTAAQYVRPVAHFARDVGIPGAGIIETGATGVEQLSSGLKRIGM
jgi:hypothetical protein